MTGFDIFGKHVGDGAPCFIVGEIAQAHHGSYDLAHAYIDAIADAGADACKFQAHLADAESWPDEPWRVKPRWGNESRFEYWKRMEFTSWQWKQLCAHAHTRGLALIVSPFSVEAVEMLDGIVDAWKVASGEISNVPLLRAVKTGIPVLWSTGMATYGDMGKAEFGLLKVEPRVPYAVLQCTSAYPCPAERVGLGTLCYWREERFRDVCPVGFSDHSGTIYAGLAAAALGCDILEVHVKLSDYDPGPDASSSVTPQQLRQLVEGVRFVEAAKKPVDKDAMAKELAPTRALFMDRHKRKAEATR